MTQNSKHCIKCLIIIFCCLFIENADAFEFSFVVDNVLGRNYTIEEASLYAKNKIESQKNTSVYEYSDSSLSQYQSTIYEGIKYCSVTPLISTNGRRIWNASLYIGSDSNDTFHIHWVLLFDDVSGEIIDLWEGQYYSYENWEKDKGFWLTWSLEDKALFSALYPSVLYPSHDYTDSRYTLPNNEEMSEKHAILLARKHLKETIDMAYMNESYIWLTAHEEIPPWIYNEYSKTKTILPKKEWHVYCCIPSTTEEQKSFTYNNISYVVDCEVFIDSDEEVVTLVSRFDQ